MSKTLTHTKPPKELKDLASFLEKHGYWLAVPFDNIRLPGFIGGFNAAGQEIIVDDGKCLSGIAKNNPAKVQLGNFARTSTFSIKSFLNVFGDLFKLNDDYLGTKAVSIKFPNPLLQTEYITELDLQEYFPKLRPICRQKLTAPQNFLIVQALETDSMEYSITIKRKLDADGKAKVEKAIKSVEGGATVNWESDTNFSILISGTKLTVGYKVARASWNMLTPNDFAILRKSAMLKK
jgi:hypothetical protein